MPSAYIACTLLRATAFFSAASARVDGTTAESTAVNAALGDFALDLNGWPLLLLPKEMPCGACIRFDGVGLVPFPFPFLGVGVAAIVANFSKARSNRVAYSFANGCA